MTKEVEMGQVTKEQALNALDQVSAMYLGNREEHSILVESIRSLGGSPTGVDEIELTIEQSISLLDKIASENRRNRSDHQKATQAIKNIKLLVEKVMNTSNKTVTTKQDSSIVSMPEVDNYSNYSSYSKTNSNYVAS